jgi:hypothetical protein
MTASALNGFAQIGYDPTGTSCQAIPYDFHPMYSTSTHQTRVTWAAGSYNVAMDTEIGHFQTCTGPISIEAMPFGLDSAGNPTECPSGDMEGTAFGMQPPDEDDYYCFPGSEALLYDVSGCTYTNTGFDGVSYQRVWPDGNTALHPSPLRFSSPTTGQDYTTPYPTAAFETDLPAIEGKPCNTHSGVQCTLIPTTDNGTPAAFYPFYSTAPTSSGCVWEFGDAIPGSNTYGENAQYGNLYAQTYTLKGGGSQAFFEDFRNDITNPCPRG